MKWTPIIVTLSLLAACNPGWRPPGAPYRVEASDEGVREAARYVLEENGLDPDGAQVTDANAQVVSGVIYSFRIQLDDRTRYHAKVYRDLDGAMKTEHFEKL